MLNRLGIFVLGHGKLRAFISGFVITFAVVSALFVALMAPFAFFCGMPWRIVFAGAVGNGIGLGLFCATLFTIYSTF